MVMCVSTNGMYVAKYFIPWPGTFHGIKMFVSLFIQNDDVESDKEEDEFELEGEVPSDVEFEEQRRQSENMEELDPHSSKFRAEGQLINYEEEPNFEGYLQVKVNNTV